MVMKACPPIRIPGDLPSSLRSCVPKVNECLADHPVQDWIAPGLVIGTSGAVVGIHLLPLFSHGRCGSHRRDGPFPSSVIFIIEVREN